MTIILFIIQDWAVLQSSDVKQTKKQKLFLKDSHFFVWKFVIFL